ncbi:thioesterase [Enterococcus florum]|uniref:Thioesterase n=1 Tax=Enterococcus florum TaxID=2480627 RepID=A0A4P5P8A5_9ENTE|nr:alpha/beta hydrolase [Enterococcus florum]GCF94217.1 thioesterase [Enterococcus florum]
MKKGQKILLVLVSVLFVAVAGGYAFLQTQSYAAEPRTEQLAEQAAETNHWLYFSAENTDKPMIIFYPGALVDTASYSGWAEKLAAAGYPVYLMKMPLDLAVLSPDRASIVLKEHPDKRYVIGGHSLGGVMASRFAKEHTRQLAGAFFLASYPDEKGSLKGIEIPVLSLTATNDQVLNHRAYQKAKEELPATTEYKTIHGGNHAGFGDYGAQTGDGESTISNQTQQVAKALQDWLEHLK